ncbi:MAG: hypothetical protein HYV07_19965 [Deltaproteobacteria bacterium]|nr:hypothetical protein [Deltaproteobacteria bacterium]
MIEFSLCGFPFAVEPLSAAVIPVVETVAIELGPGKARRLERPMRFQVRVGKSLHEPKGSPVVEAASGVYVDGPRLEGRRGFSAYEIDLRSGDGVLVLDLESRVEPDGVLEAFALSAFMTAVHTRGAYFLHGAAVSLNNRAIVLSGPSGTGKSTAAAFLAHSGLDILAEDALFLEPGGPSGARLHGVPRPAKLSPEVLRKLGHTVPPGSAHKASVPLATLGRVVETADFAVLLCPELSGGPRTRVTRLSPIEALAQASRQSQLVWAHYPNSKAHLETLASLARNAYKLELGSESLEAGSMRSVVEPLLRDLR